MRRKFLSALVGGALALATAGGVLAAPSAASSPASAQLERPGNPGRPGQPMLAAALARATADLTGLTMREIGEQLRDGKSLEQIAQSKGKTAAEVIAAARTSVKAQLDKAVASGRLTQQRADQALAQFDAQAPKVMQATGLGQGRGQGRGQGQRAGAAALVKATADVTGMTVEEVRAELKAGKSLAEIAQSKGKTVDDILNKLRENLRAREQELLDKARELINTPGLRDDQAAPPASGEQG